MSFTPSKQNHVNGFALHIHKTMLQILFYMFAKPYYKFHIPVYKTWKRVLQATKPSYAKPVAKQETKQLQNWKQSIVVSFTPACKTKKTFLSAVKP
jgi:hypothetical protein